MPTPQRRINDLEPTDCNNCIVKSVNLTVPRAPLSGVKDMAQFGQALHAVIAVNMIHYQAIDVGVVGNILESCQMSGAIDAGSALDLAERFRGFATHQLKANKVLVEYPVEYQMQNGQFVSGWIDALIETDDGYVIVDHKSSPKPRKESEQDALKYSGQLKLYKQAVEAISGKPVIGYWIHFAVIGIVVQIEV